MNSVVDVLNSLGLNPIRRYGLGSGRVAGAMAVIAILLLSPPAHAEAPFAQFLGSWTGTGKVHFSGGASEAVKCKAYYTLREAGQGLGLALRCASSSSQIELRAVLRMENDRIVGTWEERNFNAAGAVDGQAKPDAFSLAIIGGGFKGAMAVGVKGASQTVTISTEGIGMTGASMSLSRG